MRRLRRDGETLETVADALGRSVTAVSRHTTGAEGCNHDPERVGEPVTAEMSTGHRRDAITPPECAAIRARRRAGQTLVAVADALDRSRSSVGDHAQGAGGCDHDRGVVGAPVTEGRDDRR